MTAPQWYLGFWAPVFFTGSALLLYIVSLFFVTAVEKGYKDRDERCSSGTEISIPSD